MPSQNSKLVAYLAMAAGILCIGLSPIFVKVAGVPGVVSAFYRAFIAGIVIVPLGLARRDRWPNRRVLLLIAFGGFFFALDLVFWNCSLLLTSAANATLLANNAPLWVGLGALMVFRERLSLSYWCGLVISFVGMAVLIGITSLHGFHGNLGDLFALIASVFYAVYLLNTQRARAHVDTVTFMSVSSIATVLVLLAINLAMGTALTGFSNKTWLVLLGLGLISHLGGWLMISYALGKLGAARVSVTLLSQTVVAALLSIPLLGESLSGHQIAGGMIVLVGIYLANQRSAKPAEAAAGTPITPAAED